jgi:hypothetical protein
VNVPANAPAFSGRLFTVGLRVTLGGDTLTKPLLDLVLNPK